MKKRILFFAVVMVLGMWGGQKFCRGEAWVLKAENFSHYIREFNQTDDETIIQAIPNAKAWEFLSTNIPLLDYPDPAIERTYYFRWWTFRKHIKRTASGKYVVTEFHPNVPWAGKENTISCPGGHHFREGRWLHDTSILGDYAVFWFRGGASPRSYSFWPADSLLQFAAVTGDTALVKDLFPDLEANYHEWEHTRLDPCGLFWQTDNRDGMEVSIGGNGYRATINTYMFMEQNALAKIAQILGKQAVAEKYREKAAALKTLMNAKLWDAEAGFYKVLPRGEDTKNLDSGKLQDVREQHGFTPWYSTETLAKPEFAQAWEQLMDPQGFYAPFGPTTAEQRHPGFQLAYEGHECQWNGPSWPYATSITLTALANLLNSQELGHCDVLSPEKRAEWTDAFRKTLEIYAKSHVRRLPDGKQVPWIDENLHPQSGDWISRTILERLGWPRNLRERGKDYNHSTFCDLVINGLIGLRPSLENRVDIFPLVDREIPYFCLDNVLYHGRILTLFYDRDGNRYGRGVGFHVLVDGKEIFSQKTLPDTPISLPLAPGWVKFPGNPVLGGDLGVCFDISMIQEKGLFRMWFSWRTKKSIAYTESSDGIHWSEPVLCLTPAGDWEEKLNRPGVLFHEGKYHMWYTGQTKKNSHLGYATSTDGIHWERVQSTFVFAPENAWEKTSVMCPHVLWNSEQRQFCMWYSAGEQYEPNAIGYATSPDGIHWTRRPEPIFAADASQKWEQHKVTACQIVPLDGWFYMFYIGFENENLARIGIARSRDGITNWERLPNNPILGPTAGAWDADACYKPFAIYDATANLWRLWYNGRHGHVEQIGMATYSEKEWE